MSERRKLVKDIYGLRGWAQNATACIDHLVVGTVFELDEDKHGKPCLRAYGREYPLDHSLLYEAIQRSDPLPS